MGWDRRTVIAALNQVLGNGGQIEAGLAHHRSPPALNAAEFFCS
jgi:hypothetical protein